MAKGKKQAVQTINFIPLRDTIITTAYVKKAKTDIIMSAQAKPEFMPVQKIVAIGPNVNTGCENCGQVKVGDWIYIDLIQYEKEEVVQTQMKAGVGGGKYSQKVFRPPLFAAPGENEAFLKVSTREIEGYIANYDALPADLKDWQTHEEWSLARAEMEAEMRKAAEAMNLNKSVPEAPSDQAKMEEEGLKFMDTTEQNIEA